MKIGIGCFSFELSWPELPEEVTTAVAENAWRGVAERVVDEELARDGLTVNDTVREARIKQVVADRISRYGT